MVLGALMLTIVMSGSLNAQFEQKLSLNISAGYFSTLGWNGWDDNWEEHGPTLMPNFKGGPSVSAGLQYNFSRHFSVEIQLGYSFAPKWYFDASDESQEPFSYLNYEIIGDSATWEVLGSGENFMDMSNLHIGVTPKYYFGPGNRFNPFILAGISLNYTDVYFDNVEYEDYKDLGMEDVYVENYDLVNWFDDHFGLGFMAGAGCEYALNDTWGLFAQLIYHFIPLRDDAFVYAIKEINYHDLSMHLGARFSFLKSKAL